MLVLSQQLLLSPGSLRTCRMCSGATRFVYRHKLNNAGTVWPAAAYRTPPTPVRVRRPETQRSAKPPPLDQLLPFPETGRFSPSRGRASRRSPGRGWQKRAEASRSAPTPEGQWQQTRRRPAARGNLPQQLKASSASKPSTNQLAMAPRDLLLAPARLLTLAPVLPNRSDDEGAGSIEDLRAAIRRRPTTRRPHTVSTAVRTVAADTPSHLLLVRARESLHLLLFVQIQLMCGAAIINLLSVNASSDDPNQLNSHQPGKHVVEDDHRHGTLRYPNYNINTHPSVPGIQAARNCGINTQASLPGIQAPGFIEKYGT
eukprot:COSAG06_NODE_775_length_12397_cov_15.034071_4_plen_315_part_00